MDEAPLQEAANYAVSGGGGGAGMISRGGYRVYAWGNQNALFDLKSSTKSIGGTALGLALADNRLSLQDPAQEHLPGLGLPPDSNLATGWLGDIRIINLATHTSGFPKKGDYGALFFAPGTQWSYSDGGVNWLADTLTALFGEDLNSLLFRRVFSRLGITPADLVWRSNVYREDKLDGVKRRELGAGITADADAMGRIGYLYLRNGAWDGEQLIPSDFVDAVRQPHQEFVSLPVIDRPQDPNAARHYGLLWWTNADGGLPGVPADAYWSWGLLDSVIVVIPSLDLVAVRAGPKGFGGVTSNGKYSRLLPFLAPIVRSISGLTVPSVVGSTVDESTSAITASGLTLGTVSRQANTSVAEGTVLSQSPAPGQTVNGGYAVDITVSGGGGPSFSVLPSSLDFGAQALNTTSAVTSVVVENSGLGDLGPWQVSLTGVDAGQFVQTDACPPILSPGNQCVIDVSFRPTSAGTKSATLVVGTELAGTQSVSLIGTAVKATYALSPTAVNFGAVKRKTTSAVATVSITNGNVVPLPITAIAIKGTNSKQFSQTNDCGTEIAAGSACTVFVTFKPTTLGNKSGKVVVTAGGGATQKSAALSGTGT
jgi:CubicO group peptidase (beta-lactamase class C family)